MSNQIISLNVDFNDEILCCEEFGYKEYDADKIKLLVEMAANSGFNRLLWRISTCGKVNYPSKVEDVYDYRQHNKKPISDDYDPLKIAAVYARQYGVEIYAWMTLYDDNPVVMLDGSNKMAGALCKSHPEWQVLSRDGEESYPGVFCYAYPGVRQHKLAMVKELAQYDIDGVFFSIRSHSQTPEFRKHLLMKYEGKIGPEELDRWAAKTRDRFGFNDPIVEEYHSRYGIDIRRQDFDKVLWNKLRGEYLTLFLKETKEMLSIYNKRLCVMVKDKDRGESKGGHQLGGHLGDLYTDWEKWIQEEVMDELCIHDESALTWWNFKEDRWWEGALDFVRRYRRKAGAKVKLFLWLDLMTWDSDANPDYIKRYGHPGLAWHGTPDSNTDTKPPEVMRKMMEAVLKSAADGFTLHEAACIEFFSMWKSVKDVVAGNRADSSNT